VVKEVQFYTRQGCPLCDEGKRMLELVAEDIPLHIQELNIEDDEQIHEKYMLMIPVIEYKGSIIQYGNIDYATLYEALEESL